MKEKFPNLESLIQKLNIAHLDQPERLPKPVRQRINTLNVKLAELHKRAGKKSKIKSDNNIPRIKMAIELLKPIQNSKISE